MSKSALPALLTLLLLPTLALAHALNVECWVKGEKVEVKATFDDGTKPAQAAVSVVDEQGATIAAGRTDERGLWTLPTPQPGRYRVVVDAGAGHRAETLMSIGDVTGDTQLVSTGPTEEEFLRTKWLQIGLGLGAILLFCLVLWGVQRFRKKPAAPEAPSS